MAQNDIFRLLLIILLIINGYEGNGSDENNNCSLSGNLNQIVIAVLLMNFIEPKTDSQTSTTTF